MKFKEYLTENKKTTEQAKSMGLEHYGGGRWGKNGVTLYTTYYGTLMPFHGKARSVKPKPTPEDKKPIVKTKKEKLIQDKSGRKDRVYDDENLMVNTKALDHEAFQHVGKPRSEQACLYNQILHTVNIELDTDSKEVMKQYNPKGDSTYGIDLPTLIKGFNNVEFDGKKVNIDLVGTPDTIESALKEVSNGEPVIAMISTAGGIMQTMGNPESDASPRLQKNSKRFVKKGGVADPRPEDESFGDKFKNHYHALMLIGYDKKEDMVIFRDSQHDYAFGEDVHYKEKKAEWDKMTPKQKALLDPAVRKEFEELKERKIGGFLKVPMSYFKKHPNAILKFLQFNVKWK